MKSRASASKEEKEAVVSDDDKPPTRSASTQSLKISVRNITARPAPYIHRDIDPRFDRSKIRSRPPRESRRVRVFRRAHYPMVTDAEWNDWRWQSRNRIKNLAQLENLLELSADERRAIVEGGSMLPLGITPYYMSLLDPTNPNNALRRTVIPVTGEFLRSAGRGGRSAGRRRPQPGAGAGASLSGPRAVPGARFLLDLLPLLHAFARGRSRRTGAVGRAPRSDVRLHPLDAGDSRRADLRRRSARAGRRKARLDPRPAARHPAHRVHPHRHENAGRAAAADHAEPGARVAQVPSDLDERALPPSGRMHPRGVQCLRAAGRRRHSARLADRAAQRRQRRRRDDEGTDAPAAADARAAVLFVPVRPDQRIDSLPHLYTDRPGDHRRSARPHHRLRRADLRDRRPRRRRQDSAAAAIRRRPDGDDLVLRNYEGREYKYPDPLGAPRLNETAPCESA